MLILQADFNSVRRTIPEKEALVPGLYTSLVK